MLTDMDKRLIAKEEKRFSHIEKLIPIASPSNPVKAIEDLFENYHIQETTQHWYDGSPRFDNIKCDLCDDKKCNKCKTWKQWDKSEKQLSYNNWIDVWGPGIWGMTQKECDEQAKEILTEVLTRKRNLERLFFVKSKIKNEYYNIFYYNRDRDYYDWWFVFRRAPGRD